MVIIGIDAHKYTHTVVAVDGQGRQLVIQPRSSPAQPPRQPPTQRGAAPDRAQASALPPRRTSTDRPPTSKRRRRPRSNQSPQTTTLRPRLPSTPHRRTGPHGGINLTEELRTLPASQAGAAGGTLGSANSKRARSLMRAN